MAEVRVHRSTDHLAVDLFEFICRITEGDDLGGTNKGEVQWIKEENNILPCHKRLLLKSAVLQIPVSNIMQNLKRSYLDNRTT